MHVCVLESPYFELFGKAAALNQGTCGLSLFPDVSTKIETGLCGQHLSQATCQEKHFQMFSQCLPLTQVFLICLGLEVAFLILTTFEQFHTWKAAHLLHPLKLERHLV